MKRVASIHITEDKLLELICDWHGVQDDDEFTDAKSMTKFLMTKAKEYSMDKRSITPNSKTQKKVDVKISNDKSDYNLLSDIIYTVRKKLRHRGIKSIDVNSSDYAILKKLTPIINEFCNDFNLDKRAGYIEYTMAGLKRINSFRGYLSKLIDMSETISMEYEAKDIIQSDENKSKTQKIHDYYTKRVLSKTGINISYSEQPLQYINFLKVRESSHKYNVGFDVYIDAQFDGLEWTGSYPEPSQLINEKSIERLNKYLYQSNSRKKLKADDSVLADKKLTNVLNKIKNGNNYDD